MSQFRLPDVGEGLTEAQILTWHVAPGDSVGVNDVLVDIETAKSVVELPSPFAGVVGELLVDEGATVAVGTPIVTIGDAAEPATDEPQQMLVGYGPKGEVRTRRRRRAHRAEPAPVAHERPRATPPVRLLARRLGVDLTQVPCDGVITRRDVEAFADRADDTDRTEPRDVVAGRQVPHTAVRRATAAAMVASAFTAPHATEWVEADVSASVELVERLRSEPAWADLRLNHLVLRAVCLALRRTPELHGQWGDDAVTIPEHVGLGVATATERGLVVPVVPAADSLDLRALVGQVGDLVATARAGRLTPAQMSGGTFSVTNVGVFGVDGGTPILPPGQTGILAVGAVARKPWVDADDQVVPRWVTTFALSFDHRAVDGHQASVFLRDVADLLTDPALALAW